MDWKQYSKQDLKPRLVIDKDMPKNIHFQLVLLLLFLADRKLKRVILLQEFQKNLQKLAILLVVYQELLNYLETES